jgi:hypothetical protein
LIASPAFIVMQAADKFSQPTTRVNQLWQTDFERHEALLNLAVVRDHRHASVAADAMKLRAA